jgi:hypothetical protein
MKKITLTILIVATFFTAFAQTKKIKIEQTNTNNFHLVDFVGYNTSIEVLANYHTSDVKVFGAGYSTLGMHDHETMLSGMIKQYPDTKIIEHFPNVAKGEWTAVVGHLSGNTKMATFAKWKNGKIAEEYLFTVLLPENLASTMKTSAKPIVSFANSNDKELAVAVNLQPNWSCVMEEVNGKRTAYFIKTVDGKEVERMVFQ